MYFSTYPVNNFSPFCIESTILQRYNYNKETSIDNLVWYFNIIGILVLILG